MCSYCGCVANTVQNILGRHIDKEDNGLFPAAIIALDGDDWECVVNAA